MPGRLALLAAALLASASSAQEASDDTRSSRPLSRCIVAQQFDSPDTPAYCLDDGVNTRAGQFGAMLRGLQEDCCDEDFATALDALSAEFDVAASRAPALAVNRYRLDDVLAQMQLDDDARKKTWWERFVDWLDELLREEESDNDSALIEWLEGVELPEWAGTALKWTVYILLIGAALAIVWNELRVAGVFGRRRGGAAPAISDAAHPAPGMPGRRWPRTGIDKLAPLEQAVALFSTALDTLRETGALPADDSLTNLELSRRLRADDRHKQSFDRLRASADRALYAEIAPDPDELSMLRQAWRAIDAAARPAGEAVTA